MQIAFTCCVVYRGQDGWLASDSVDMSLSKLQETVKDREGWHAAVYGGRKELDTTECLNNTQLSKVYSHPGLYTLSVFSDILKHLQFLCIIA